MKFNKKGLFIFLIMIGFLSSTKKISATVNITGNDSNGYGTNIVISKNNSHALGKNINIDSKDTIGIGTNIKDLSNEKSISIGNDIERTGERSIALGNEVKALGNLSIAIGDRSTASGKISVAIGERTTASGQGAIAIGEFASSETDDTIALGTDSKAKGEFAVAIGRHAKAISLGAISIGAYSEASQTDAYAIGMHAGAQGENSIAIGKMSKAKANNSLTFGSLSSAEGVSSIALGANAFSKKENSIAMGIYASSVAENAIAIGNNAYSSYSNSVVLGKDSYDREAKEIREAEINGNKIGQFMGNAKGVVSIGFLGEERQIINVAPGEISKTSTDGINGSQLYYGLEKISSLPAIFYSSSNKIEGTYATNINSISEMSISKLKLDFGYGLKAKEVTDDKNNKVVLVTLDKNTIKDDTDFKGPKGEQGVEGPKGEAGKDGKSPTAFVINNGDGTHTLTVTNSNGTKTTTIIKDGQGGRAIQGEMKYAADNNINSPEVQKLTTTLSVVSGEIKDTEGNNYSGTNLVTEYKQVNGDGSITIALKENPTFKDIKSDSLTIGDTTISVNGLEIKDGSSITKAGINAGDKKITNVADGKVSSTSKEAVNGSQLQQTNSRINNIEQNQNYIYNAMDELKDETRKGLANAAAMSTLEFMEIGINQATVGAAIGTHRGNQAVAVGVQTAPTENTRIHAKVSVSPSKRKSDYMAGVGASWRFNIK